MLLTPSISSRYSRNTPGLLVTLWGYSSDAPEILQGYSCLTAGLHTQGYSVATPDTPEVTPALLWSYSGDTPAIKSPGILWVYSAHPSRVLGAFLIGYTGDTPGLHRAAPAHANTGATPALLCTALRGYSGDTPPKRPRARREGGRERRRDRGVNNSRDTHRTALGTYSSFTPQLLSRATSAPSHSPATRLPPHADSAPSLLRTYEDFSRNFTQTLLGL